MTRDGVEADTEAGLGLSVQLASVTRGARGENGVCVCGHPVQREAGVTERPPGHVDTAGRAVLQHLSSLVICCLNPQKQKRLTCLRNVSRSPLSFENEMRYKLRKARNLSPLLTTILFRVSWLISPQSLSVCFDCPEPVMSPLSWAHKLALVVPQYSG